MIRGDLYLQGFMGDPMSVAPEFHGNPDFWCAYGKEQGDECEAQLAA